MCLAYSKCTSESTCVCRFHEPSYANFLLVCTIRATFEASVLLIRGAEGRQTHSAIQPRMWMCGSHANWSQSGLPAAFQAWPPSQHEVSSAFEGLLAFPMLRCFCCLWKMKLLPRTLYNGGGFTLGWNISNSTKHIQSRTIGTWVVFRNFWVARLGGSSRFSETPSRAKRVPETTISVVFPETTQNLSLMYLKQIHSRCTLQGVQTLKKLSTKLQCQF